MIKITDHPLLVFALTFVMLWVSAWVGAYLSRNVLIGHEGVREDFGLVLAATLTLLGLIIGFSFSMATGRYDQRKNYEEVEANAIGTEYVRADFLPAADAAKVRALLKSYLDQRILFYKVRDEREVREVDARTAQLQAELWSAILPAARANPHPVMALVVSGMNDVLNSQSYTQAAWWYRIPVAAWILMAAIAVCCNVLVGYRAHDFKKEAVLLLVLPIVVSVSFYLIADIESPRRGLILVGAPNLESLAESLRAPIAKP